MATPQTFSQNDASHELNLDEARTVFAVIPDAYDTNERVVKMAMLVWNTGSLSWVKFTGSAGGGGGAVTVADGADVAEGTTTDAAVVSDVSGTVSGKLRGLVKMLADMWDSVNHRLNVAVGNFPAGFNVNNSPTVNQGGAPWSVSGTVGLGAGSAVIGHVIVDSGSITVNTITGFALEAGHIATIDAKTPALGQAQMAASVPIAIASDQSAVPMSAAALPLPANAAQEASGNLSAIAAADRVRNRLLFMQALRIQPGAGFFPMEIPEFLGGI